MVPEDNVESEEEDECREWRVNGKRHREDDLPAVITSNGDKYWYINGNLHRDNGRPAVEMANGEKEWYISGCRVPEPTFDKYGNAKHYRIYK